MSTCWGTYTVRRLMISRGPQGGIIHSVVLFVSSEPQCFPVCVVCMLYRKEKRQTDVERERLEQEQSFFFLQGAGLRINSGHIC